MKTSPSPSGGIAAGGGLSFLVGDTFLGGIAAGGGLSFFVGDTLWGPCACEVYPEGFITTS